MSFARDKTDSHRTGTGRDTPNHDGGEPGGSMMRRLGLPVVMVVVTVAAYAGSFDGVFLLDDERYFQENPRIRSLWPLSEVLSDRRPVVDLTLAINYAAGGLNPWGYHLVNLVIHICAGLTLFGLIRRTLISLRGHAGVGASTGIAIAAAMIWLVHPLQTQAVTYLVQRAESLMGLFYLLTMYTFVRGAELEDGRGRIGWFLGSVMCCALGMGCKAIMVTAPVMVLLFDAMFFAGSLLAALRLRWGLYAGLCATWILLVVFDVATGVFSTSRTIATVGFSYRGVSWWAYLATQPGVLMRYLGLSLFPYPQCLDYAWPTARTVGAIAGPALAVLVLVGLTVWGWVKRRPLAFCGIWFFGVLLPTSSIIPMRDALFEHRMYLSLAGVVLVVVCLAYRLLQRFRGSVPAWSGRGLLVVTVAALSVVTFIRNEVYGSAITMWEDVVAKRPENPRGYTNLGSAYYRAERREEARRMFEEALRLDDQDADAHYNLGLIFSDIGEVEASMMRYEAALTINPRHAKAAGNLAVTLARLGRVEEALAISRKSVALSPFSATAHHNLAALCYSTGDSDCALEHGQMAVELDPQFCRSHVVLGLTRARMQEYGAAEWALRRAVACDAGVAAVWYALGRCLLEQGKVEEGVRAVRECLRLDPGQAEAAALLSRLGAGG